MNKVIQAFREEITRKIIDAIEKGTAPWQKPWSGREAHKNALTGRCYTGINQLNLSIVGMSLDGGQDPRWLTFNQANGKGWKIKKGAKGAHVSFWKTVIFDNNEEDEHDDENKTVTVWEKIFTVFHASQVEGIDEYVPLEISDIKSNETVEKIVSDSGAKIYYGGGRAFYSPIQDFIQLPPKEDFTTSEGYYSTLLHELTHWTGHESRLNRGFGKSYTPEYAFEELVAEIGSLFVSELAGIKHTQCEFQNHASYVDSWLKELKRNSKYIFKAAAQANKAANFLLRKSINTDEC